MSVYAGPEIVNDGLVLCLDAANVKSYPGSGTTWKDLSGNENNGSIDATVSIDTSNKSMDFDGTNEKIVFPPIITTTDFTISQVVQPISDTEEGWLWSQYDPSANGRLICNTANSCTQFRFFIGGTSLFSNTTITPGEIYHIAWIREGSTGKIYINGVLDVSGSISANDIPNTQAAIGASIQLTSLKQFIGSVYTTSVYGRALSAAEIQQNYNASVERFYPPSVPPSQNVVTDGLELYLDAANVKSYPGTGTTWTDLTGNGYNGEFVGDTSFDNNIDKSIAFDGAGDYASFSTYPDFNATSFTVGCWFKTTDGDMRLIGNRLNGSAGTIPGWKISARNGHWGNTGVDDGNGNEISFSDISNSPYIDGNWHLVVLVFDTVTGSCSLNIDGVNLSTKTKATLIGDNFNSTSLVLARSNSNDQYLNGNISSVFIYSKALTESEIQQNYNALRGRYGV